MALGPFISYVPPGVYTRTLTDANVSNLVAGLRIPVIIGVGQEELEQDDVEIVRGSSSTVDQQIVNEDVSKAWVVSATNPSHLQLGPQDGTLTTFQVKNYPVVDGQGFGRTSNDPRTVTVTVNSVPVGLATLSGANGLVTLQIPTQPSDVVRVTYFFHRGDTAFLDDVSNQVTPQNASLISPGFEPFNIVTGTNDQFILTANGVTATITLLPGALTAAGLVSLINGQGLANLMASVSTDGEGFNHLQLTATQSILIGAGTANGPLGWSTGTQTNRNTHFRVYEYPIVDGSGGGVTTTDPSKVTAKVNGTQVLVTAVDGKNGVVTLPFAPAPGSTITLAYFSNTWQDTFDYLPNSLITSILRCGISAQRNDFIQGADFIVSNPTSDVSLVNWGASIVVAAGTTATNAVPFDGTTGSGGQIQATLVDEKYFLAACTPVVNTTVIPAVTSSTQFVLPEVPTTGNGRDTPLGLPLFNSVTNGRQDLTSNRPDLITVYAGRGLRDALNKPTIPVLSVAGATRTITLSRPVPPDWTVFATFWYNKLEHDTFILTSTVPGSIGLGQYTILDTLTGANLFEVRFGAVTGLSTSVQWPRGAETIPDAFFTGAGKPVAEVVTVTFSQSAASNAAFTNRSGDPYNFFAPNSATWSTLVNGSTATTNLAAAAKAYLVGGHVKVIQSGPDLGKITIPASPGNQLNLTIDGHVIATISLTAGNVTPASIVTAINTAIDANANFVGTAPNLLCSFVQIGPSTGDVIFILKSLAIPAALPGGFDSPAAVKVGQGTVEATLGWKSFQSAAGTPGAVNKPATLLSGIVGPYNITAGLNDQFVLRVNGTDYTVTLPPGAAVATTAIVTAINTVPGLAGVASDGTLANLGFLRLTSPTNDGSSSILLLNGSANATLGFVQNQLASQTLVGAHEVVDELMATSAFTSGAFAYVDSINGANFITFESLTVGASTSSIGFVNAANSSFNPSTGIGLTPGVDGDNGEDPHDMYTVTSSSPAGSAGTGIPGQTYTDANTGLRFTVLPASVGTYGTGSFTLLSSPTFHVDPSTPRMSIPGVEMVVSNTVGVGINDTATLQTYNPGGLQPAVGDFYFISYKYQKQDFTTRIYQTLKTIEANFGATSPENRVTLAAYLAILNGAVLIGISQVLKVPNTDQASDQAFINAIAGLATPLPGNVKPDILVPLSTGTAVYSYLTNHCETQSNIRNQAERIGFIGFASGTSPSNAQIIAKTLNSSRIIAFYPDSVVVTLTDELNNQVQSVIDGSFYGAAVAGAVVSPSVDVATPYTRRRVQGFTSIPRILDPVDANQTATSGITLLEDLGNGFLRIRQGLTTNMASILTRLPTVTQISDFVQQQSRALLDSYVGTKFLSTRTNEVVVSMTGLFKSLVQAEIISAFTGLSASVDANDPTILNFQAFYAPIFPLLYLVLTFNLRSSV